MSLQRLRSPYSSQSAITTGFVGPPPVIEDAQGDNFSMHEFTGDGTAGTNVGQLYKVYQWKNIVDVNNYSEWKTDPDIFLGGNGTFKVTAGGYADLLICGAGGGGGGAYQTGAHGSNNGAGSGGGGGGVILRFNYKLDADLATAYSVFAGMASQKDTISGAHPEGGQPSWIKKPDGSTLFEAFGGGPGQTGWGRPPNNSEQLKGPWGSSGGQACYQTDSTAVLFPDYTGGPATPGQGHRGGTGSYSNQAAGGGGGAMQPGGAGLRGTSAMDNLFDKWPGNGGDGLVMRFNGAEEHKGYGAGGGGANYASGRQGAGGAGGGIPAIYNANGNRSNNTDEYGFGAGGGGSALSGGDQNRKGHGGTAGIVMIRIPI